MKRIYYIFFIAIMLFSCEKPISDFQSKNFIKFFGSGYESKGNDIVELADGGYVITGYDKVGGTNYQVYIAKIDENGNVIWGKTFGSPICREEGKVVKEVSDGFIIAGTSLPNSASITHSFIMKVSTNGDSTSYKEFGDPTYSIFIDDIAFNDNYIFVAGHSNESDVNKTAFYRAKLDLIGNTIFGKSNFKATNSLYRRVFVAQDDNLLYSGTYGANSVIALATIPISSMMEANTFNTPTNNESLADALFVSDKLFLLATVSSANAKLYKFDANYTEIWHTDPIDNIVGKSIAYNEDGSLMICGESTVDGNQVINFIKVNTEGNTEYGLQIFRTFSGTVGKLIATKDRGLILIGSTNATYGTNIQLIKTDKDYFMLKSN